MSLDNRFVHGIDKLKRRIDTIKAGVPFALNAAMDDVGKLLLKRIKDRYIRQVNPDGIAWESLAQSTLKRKKYPPTKTEFRTTILKSTELLFNSIDLVKTDKERFFASATGAGVRIGVVNEKAAAYGRLHQNGIKNRLPQRRFLGISQLDIKATDSLLRRRIDKLISASAT